MITTACSEPMKYTMSTRGQVLMIDGLAQCLAGTVFLLRGFGHRFHDLGITDGTTLLCTNGITPKDGELVVRMCGEQPVLYLFRPNSSEEFEGLKRVLNDVREVDAVVACSFNFYQ